MDPAGQHLGPGWVEIKKHLYNRGIGEERISDEFVIPGLITTGAGVTWYFAC